MEWAEIHERVVRVAGRQAEFAWDEGQVLLEARRAAIHVYLGCGSFLEYVERYLGYGPRFAMERLRVADALTQLPVIGAALKSGAVHWSVARELTRVAAETTEEAWLAAARNKTVRQVEELVAGLERGDRPGDEKDDSVRRHVLRLEVSAETMATWREAIGRLREQGLDEDAAVLVMARQALDGPADPGRAGYQIAMTVCPRCEKGSQVARGEALPVDAAVVEMAECDAQVLGRKANQSVTPKVRREVVLRDRGRCVVPGCRAASHLDVHHLVLDSEGGGHDASNLVVACAGHHRALHAGFLAVEGAVGALRFRHADGTELGGALTPAVAMARSETFQALRQLGFKEGEARWALERVTHVGPTEEVLRLALRELGQRLLGYSAAAQKPSRAEDTAVESWCWG